MRFPSREEERVLHERILGDDSLATDDVFKAFMDPLSDMLQRETGCDEDAAHDAAVDAVFVYIDKPEKYDSQRALLRTYLRAVARNRLREGRRSDTTRVEREKKWASVVLPLRNPKEEMEEQLEAKRALERLVAGGYLEDLRDRAALRLILEGERSTESLAEALGLSHLPKDEMRLAVKQNRDRLMKVLARFGKKEEPDDES